MIISNIITAINIISHLQLCHQVALFNLVAELLYSAAPCFNSIAFFSIFSTSSTLLYICWMLFFIVFLTSSTSFCIPCILFNLLIEKSSTIAFNFFLPSKFNLPVFESINNGIFSFCKVSINSNASLSLNLLSPAIK